jgi:hypothetical protein
MHRKVKAAVFASHHHGDASFHALLMPPLSKCLDVVIVATDDPCLPYANAAGRLWSHGWDEWLRTLVSRRAEQCGLPVYTGRIRSREFWNDFRQSSPDVLIVNCFGQRVPENMLRFVGYRAFNLHLTAPGFGLEATSGPRALEKVLELGATHLQMTLHRMSEEFDQGEVLAQSEPFPIPETIRRDPTSRQMADFYRESTDLPASFLRQDLPGILVRELAGLLPAAR